MSLFEEPEWGSSQVFSYYESPGSPNFMVSSSVLETSLQKVQKKRKRNSGAVKRNEGRKLVEEGTVPIDGQEKKKKQNCKDQRENISQSTSMKNETTGNIIESKAGNHSNLNTGEGQGNAAAADSSSKKKKKKKNKKVKDAQKKLLTSQADSAELKSATSENGTSASISSPKKKKKSVNRRNKYKDLNIEQNKKKNAIVNGEAETPLKTVSSLSLISDKSSKRISDEHIENVGNEGDIDCGQSIKKSDNVVGKSFKKNPDQSSNNILEKDGKIIGNKNMKKKHKKISQNPNEAEGIMMSGTFREDVDGSGKGDVIKSPKRKKGKKSVEAQSEDWGKGLKSVFSNTSSVGKLDETLELSSKGKRKKKGKGGENNVEVENPSEDKSKVLLERANLKLGKRKLKTSYCEVNDDGEKKRKVPKISKVDLLNKNKKFKDGGDEDIELGHDIESYMKELNFDKLKNGVPFNVDLSSDDDESFGNISHDESEDEYLEDELPKEKGISSKSKVATKSEAVMNKHEKSKDKPIKLAKEKSSPSVSERQDKEKQLTSPSHPVNLIKEKKFDKNILNKMLQEAAQKDEESETNSKESAVSAAEALREKMTNQLNTARFRLVNEQLYKATSSEAVKMFKADPKSFTSYHTGFQSQVALWPMNPLDVIINWLKNKPKHWVVADFGCGEATLAASVPQNTVHSFDLMSVNPRVKVCDMSHTPLQSKSVDVVVFCLSLMGTNIKDFILEASRVLKEGGIMKIAEVESRFNDTNHFVSHIKKFGFHCVFSDTSTKYFYMFEFKKHRSLNNKSGVPNIILKPCKYKKR